MSCATCCLEAKLSCCNSEITILTTQALTAFEWRIDDELGNVYTGVDVSDNAGALHITDLPEGFLDAPGKVFTIKLNRPALVVQEYDCFDVTLISGAYLGIPTIGEPLANIPVPGSNVAIFNFTDADTYSIPWTPSLAAQFGQTPIVQVYHLVAADTYQLANVAIQIVGDPVTSIEIDNGGPATGYAIVSA